MPASREERLPELDRLIHEPARLAIMTVLSECASADFLFLQSLTRLTKGNLSSHIYKLEEAGLVTIDKSFVNRKPKTTVKLTKGGRAAIEAHWRRLGDLKASAAEVAADTDRL